MKQLLLLLLLSALLLSTAACGLSPAPEPLQVMLLRVGKADAILLRCAGKTMVIDAGESDDGKDLCRTLSSLGSEQVDVLLITHFDRDHVGGAATLCRNMAVGLVLLPDYEGDNAETAAFLAALAERDLRAERLREPVSFTLGDCEVLVEPPEDYTLTGKGEQDNNLSLITTVRHGKLRLVFAGDAEKQRLRQWLKGDSALPCDFLKLPHHGVYNAALPQLLRQLQPAVTVICDSDKNPAEAETLAALEAVGTRIYETRDGSVTVLSDGKNLEITQN